MDERILTEKRLSTMEQKIDNLTKSVEEIAKDIKSLDTRYSGKWVEKAIVAIGTGVVIAIFSLIFSLMSA